MKLVPVGSLSRALDFNPRTFWPDVLPAVAVGPHLLCGFDRGDSDLALQLPLGQPDDARKTFKAALKACHPRLGLCEWARLHQKMTESGLLDSLALSFTDFSDLSGWRWNSEAVQLLKVLFLRAREIQDWLDQKQFMARELAIWLDVANPADLDLFALAALRLSLSRSDAAKAIEWSGELLMQGHEAQTLLPRPEETAELWQERIRGLRFPRSAARDQSRRSQIAHLPWPAHVSGEWVRQGDEDALQIQIRVRDASELSARLKGLETLAPRLASEEDLWKA